MTEPLAVQAWAVVGPDGSICNFATGKDKPDAWFKFEKYHGITDTSRYELAGYIVRRVTIQLAEGEE